MNEKNLPGFGDEVTWPAPSGRANDPRYEPDDDVDARVWLIEEIERIVGSCRLELAKPEPMLARIDSLLADIASEILGDKQ